MSQLPMPSGTVTFLFTDIEESTKRWEVHPTSMRAALAQHDAILRAAIEKNGGCVFKTVGDAFCAAFSSPYDALAGALELQRALAKEEWPPETGPIRVRAALHTGAIDEQGGDYFGQPLNRVARLLSAGHGGQTLLSLATQELVRDNLPPAVQLVDMGQHRLKDLTRPEHISQLQTEGLPAEFPPLRTLDNRPNNLPEQLTPLIGREREVDSVCAMLRDQNVRLATLTGPGGTGKTRVALQAAAELLDGYPDGTWFVDLSPVTDSTLVVSRIAQALGVREAGGAPLINTLKSCLKGRRLVLLLDNFEQVLPASGTITELLRSAAGVQVLVTSRMKLSLYGEHDYEVPPLSVPDTSEGRMPPLERLNQYEAVRLFIERAQAVKADFQVTNDNAPEVAEICVRLDGLPLAIELAAARVRMLPPNALLARLSERLRLLTGGSRDLPARHQTLRGAIGWSYDLLSEGEKQLFSRIAVLNGGRTIEALEDVCNYDGELQVDVLDGVQLLIDESLLQEREGRNGEPRFWMLETIHEYAREKLKESGEGDSLRGKHAGYFLAMAEEAEAYLGGPRQQEWLDRLEDEHDNLRAAVQWAKESEDAGAVEAGLRLVAALREFWILRGYYTEGRTYLRDLLAKTEQSPQSGESKESRAKALTIASVLAYVDGDIVAAKPLGEEALRLARETGDRSRIADALHNLGNIVWDPTEARTLHEESLAIKRDTGDKEGIAAALNSLAIATLESGEVEEARRLYDAPHKCWENTPCPPPLGHAPGGKVTMTSRKRIAIVGAGHNALVCTCYLAKAGHDVTVYERRSQVGGAVNTEEMWWEPCEAHRGIGGSSKPDMACENCVNHKYQVDIPSPIHDGGPGVVREQVLMLLQARKEPGYAHADLILSPHLGLLDGSSTGKHNSIQQASWHVKTMAHSRRLPGSAGSSDLPPLFPERRQEFRTGPFLRLLAGGATTPSALLIGKSVRSSVSYYTPNKQNSESLKWG